MPNAASRIRDLMLLAPVLLVLAAVLALFSLYVVGAVNGIQAPSLLEYGEPYIVSASWNLAQGGSLYAPVEDLPFLHNNYNPLVQTLLAPALAITGPSYVTFRTLTFVSVLLIIALLWGMIWSATRSALAATIGALLPLAAGFTHAWLYVGRVDVFATLFSVACFAWALHFRDGPARRRWWFLAFALVAFCAKQSVVGGAAAVMLDTFLRGRRKEAIAMGVAFVGLCALATGLFNLLSDGQHWLHAIVYNASHDRSGWWPPGLTLEVMLVGSWTPPLLLLLAASLALARWRHDAPWICWVAVSLPLSFWLVRKSGAHVHYFLEPICAVAVLGTLAVYRQLRAQRTRRGPVPVLLAAFIGVLGLALLHGPTRELPGGVHWAWHRVKGMVVQRDRPDPVPLEVRELLAAAGGPPLLIGKSASLAIEAGRPAIFDVADFVRLHQLGRFDPRDRLIPLIEAHAFPLIGIAEYAADDPAPAHFRIDSLPGVRAAIEAGYRRLPEGLDDPAYHRASFWVPRQR